MIEQDPTPRDIPSDAPGAPKAIADAIAAAKSAGDTLETAKAEAAEAKAGVKQAEAADVAADREAVALGDAMQDHKATAKAKSAVDAAERKVAAAEAVFKEKVGELTAALRAEAAAWISDLEQEHGEGAARVVDALDTYDRERRRMSHNRRLRSTLARFADGDHNPWSATSLRPPRYLDEDRHRDREEQIRAIRSSRRFAVVEAEDRVPAALLDLELFATGQTPFDPQFVGRRSAGEEAAAA